jgi:hypothetical protein
MFAMSQEFEAEFSYERKSQSAHSFFHVRTIVPASILPSDCIVWREPCGAGFPQLTALIDGF